ncbi:MAG: hypothetical protein AB7S72_05295 [Draconibacterium sp.]
MKISILKILPLVIFLWAFAACTPADVPKNAMAEKSYPDIFPEYAGVTIPPNIAPLNFLINETGEKYFVQITSSGNQSMQFSSKSPEIKWNNKKWRKLLADNRGKEFSIKVFVFANNYWKVFEPVVIKVANEEIDSYLTYRLINSAYVLWFDMGLYQRNLENFDQEVIIENKSVGGACVNCHSFSRNNPDKMMFHIRAKFPGTVIYNNGKLEKVETRTDYTLASAAYGNWHPNGRHIAFSVNKINQNFHIFKNQSNEVSDKYSDLIIYDTESHQITTSPAVSTRSRENLPEWSADGKTLYFISAPEAVDDSARMITRYSLMKIPYDVDDNVWGEADTVISANQTGRSITFPRTSPDGRFIAFCMTNYGYFTIHHKTSDIFLFDIEKQQIIKPEGLNSSATESYHSWSVNGRWLVFSSRRIDGVHTRTFIAYVEPTGKMGKPFVLPQKHPGFYDDYLLNFNRPELMTGKIKLSPQEIRDAARGDALPVQFDPKVNLDALSGASKITVK